MANVSRATFYWNYNTTEDLLFKWVEQLYKSFDQSFKLKQKIQGKLHYWYFFKK